MKPVNRPLRVGFVGAGYIADWHAKALVLAGGAELAAVCDLSLGRAQAFAQGHGIAAAFASVEEMLASANLDAVHVLTTPESHAVVAEHTLAAGVATLVEKPMCPSAAECERLIAVAAARNVTLAVGHNFLFSPVYERLRADLAAGLLGRLDHVAITWHKELPQVKAGPFDAWMLREPANVMLEVGSHGVAHLLDLVGGVDDLRVHADNATSFPGGTFFRRWAIDARRGPTAARLDFAFGPGFAEHVIHARGTTGSATVDFERNTYVLRRHTTASDDFDRHAIVKGEATSLRRQGRSNLLHYVLSKAKLSKRGSPYGSSIAGCLSEFYAAVRKPGDLDVRCAPNQARDVITLCQRIGELADVINQPLSPEPPVIHPRSTVLVLGATGFIGAALTRKLIASGKAVRVLVRNPGRLPIEIRASVDVVRGDISNPSDLNRALVGITHVFHLARANVKTWGDYQRQEIEPTKLVGAKCVEHKIQRLIYTGTIDSYYAGRQAGTITEKTPLDPKIRRRNLYARAKAESESNLKAMADLPLVIVRPGIVLGKGGTPFHWGVGSWPRGFVCQIWGRGENPLPLVLVDDVCEALIAAMERPGIVGDSFNVVGEPSISATEYIAEIERAAGMKLQAKPRSIAAFYFGDVLKWLVKCLVRHPERRRPSWRDWQSRTQRAVFDCSRTRQALGWKPVGDREELIRHGIWEPVRDAMR